ETLGFGINGNLLEQTWQKEFYRIGTQIFYVDGMDWAIEFLRCNRFEPTGEYKEIAKYAKSVAIIDIRSESKK
ncbi:6202_t:CDS:2, partial [Dentiscutata heterogama]